MDAIMRPGMRMTVPQRTLWPVAMSRSPKTANISPMADIALTLFLMTSSSMDGHRDAKE